MRRLANISGLTVVLFLVWKVVLLLVTAQPVPGNDSFFYDGPVVNYVLHGKYCNPSLAQVLPISGTEVFSAYPPLYQAMLLGWMKCFGVSALATMWFHATLLGLFALTVLQIFRQLQVPAVAANLAGLFLFGLTFHDRPDTLAHVLGALALLALVRGLIWSAAVFLLLTFATSLQIGGIYSLWLALATLGSVWLAKNKFPWAAASVFVAAFLGLVALVKFGYPQLWAGFREHVQITPSVTGLRLPRADDLLKIIRTAPGILLVLAALFWFVLKRINFRAQLSRSPQIFMASFGALAALALIGGCLFILTPNTIHIASYLQPVIVGCFLAALAGGVGKLKLGKVVSVLFVAAALLVSVRAIGMTTWGWLCSRDMSYVQAIARVNEELDSIPAGETVFASSAFLYEVAQRTNVTWIHSDWPSPAAAYDSGFSALGELQPAKVLLTQFDYYRRYEPAVAQFRRERGDVEVRITNLARVQPPDAIPATRKIVQHISWAPVIIEFSWPQPAQSK
jgi:hypothetical protein